MYGAHSPESRPTPSGCKEAPGPNCCCAGRATADDASAHQTFRLTKGHYVVEELPPLVPLAPARDQVGGLVSRGLENNDSVKKTTLQKN